MRQRQGTLFDDAQLRLDQAVELSLESLRAYGEEYNHWAVAFSGGKDSTATVALVAWAILSGRVRAPKSLTVLYADTRLELPPLQQGAMEMLAALDAQGFQTRVVTADIDNRFFVYMLGRGVPPPNNYRLRWCTNKIKVAPMMTALEELRWLTGEKVLMFTGVRLGESAKRDQRISVSCSTDAGECGQGWFQTATDDAVADTLAPLLHWRVCHVYDWLYFDPSGHGYRAHGVADVYGESEVRTGCVGCPLASRDVALERLLKKPEWSHLSPLLELKPLWRELRLAQWRKRKARPEKLQSGGYGRNPQRKGPLTMKGRAYGLERVLDIQARAGVDLINDAEERRIRELWALDTWPRKWSADDIDADVLIPERHVVRGHVVEQALLIR